jgi:hypothetical protein
MGRILLDIAQRNPGIETGRAAVMNACLSVCGVTVLVLTARRGDLADNPPGAVTVQSASVGGQEHRPVSSFLDSHTYLNTAGLR